MSERNLWRPSTALFFTLPVFFAAILAAGMGEGTVVSLLNDGATDLLWARHQLEHGLALNGHWSNSLGTTHPGPMYLYTMMLGGVLARTAGVSFDVGAFALLMMVTGWIVALTATAVGRASGRLRNAWAVFLAAWVVALAPVTDPDAGWPRIGWPTWGGMSPAWLLAAVVVGGWLLTGTWRYRHAFVWLMTGLAVQQYLPAIGFTIPVVAVSLWQVFRRRSGRPGAIDLVAVAAGWGPLVLRAVLQGPAVFLPTRILGDHTAGDNTLADGAATVGFHLFGIPGPVAVATHVVVAVAAAAMVLMSPGRRRLSLIVFFVSIAGLAQQLIVWPAPVNRYQSAWVTVIAAYALGLALVHWLPRALSRVLLGTAAVFVVTMFLTTSHDPVPLLPSDEFAVRIAGQRVAELVEPGSRVAVYIDQDVWDAGQASVNVLVNAGLDVCVVGREDLAPLSCRDERTIRLVVREALPADPVFLRSGIVIGGVPLTLLRATSDAELPVVDPSRTGHPNTWR